MKKITFFLIIAFSLVKAHAQFVHVIKADSVLITNDSCTAELNLENSTKNVKGFLYNKGNGRTEFRKMVKLNDSTLIFGGDTVLVRGVGGPNFANTDLTLTGDRNHKGNFNFLNLDSFSLFRFRAANHAIDDDTMYTVVLIDSNGFYLINRENYLDSTIFNISEGNFNYEVHANGYLTGYINADAPNIVIGSYHELNGTETSLYLHNGGSAYLQGNSVALSSSSIGQNSRMYVNSDFGDSIILGGFLSPLTVTTKYKQTHNRFEFQNLNGVNDFRLLGLPSSTSSTDSVLVSDANGQIKKRGQSQIGTFTLQQVTDNGNSTTNTIKPYPNALPPGTNTDSVVVWSASDSLLKKIGSKQTFAQTATVTVSGTTDQTTLVSSGAGSLTIPTASWFVGKTFKVVLHGTYSTSSTSPPSLTIKIKLGTTVIATGSVNLSANKSDVAFDGRAEFTCRSTGSSGTVFAMGMISTADGAIKKLNNGTTAITVDLSTNQTLSITATLSDASAGNAVSAYVILLEAMN